MSNRGSREFSKALRSCVKLGLSGSRVEEALIDRTVLVGRLKRTDELLGDFVDTANNEEATDKDVQDQAEKFADRLCDGEDHKVFMTEFYRPITHDCYVSQIILSGPEIRQSAYQTKDVREFFDNVVTKMNLDYKESVLEAFHEWVKEK